ncbi:inositol-phosphate phosphatase/L-galactose 1-phosphate phosphatase/histidinol-phosphatase [Bradyrhizobium sp. USDA 4369]
MQYTDSPDLPKQEALLAFACAMADAAGVIARRYFRSVLSFENKADGSPVTRADRDIEALLRDMIRQRFPGDGVLGEEQDPEALDSDRVWVIDPIDGTKSFMSGMPTFGTLLALVEQGKPRLGVIDMPALGERWIGTDGRATTVNGAECSTRDCISLADAVVYTTSPDIFSAEEAERFDQVSRAAAMRRFGGDCYAYALLASGHVDAVIESSLKPFDYLALVPVIEGAGGMITDWDGRALGISSGARVVAAATAQLHAELLEGLRI